MFLLSILTPFSLKKSTKSCLVIDPKTLSSSPVFMVVSKVSPAICFNILEIFFSSRFIFLSSSAGTLRGRLVVQASQKARAYPGGNAAEGYHLLVVVVVVRA